MAKPQQGYFQVVDGTLNFLPGRSLSPKSKRNNYKRKLLHLDNFMDDAALLFQNHNISEGWQIQHTFLQHFNDNITKTYISRCASLLNTTDPSVLTPSNV